MTSTKKSGFSLIEMMVAVGIMSVVGMGFAKMLTQSLAGQRNVAQTADANDIKGILSALLSSDTVCTANLGSLRTSPALGNVVNTSSTETYSHTENFVGIGTPPPVQVVVAAPLPPSNSIRIDSWAVINWTATGVTSPGIRNGTAVLRLHVTKIGGGSGPQSIIRDIPLIVNVNDPATTTINRCYATSVNDTFWLRGSVANAIYYNGLVGINTSAPAAALDVQGPFRQLDLGGSTAGSAGGIQFRDGSGAMQSTIGYLSATDTTTMDIFNPSPTGIVSLSAGSSHTRAVNALGSNGFVGIDTTTNISAALQVNGGLRAKKGFPALGDSSNVGYAFDQDGDTGLFASGSSPSMNSDLSLYIDSVDRFHVSHASGYVGIGNATPISNLTVGSGSTGFSIGSIDVSTGAWLRSALDTVLSTNTGSLFLGYAGNSGKTIHIGNSAPGAVTIMGSAPASSMAMDGSGNVTLNHNLTINGSTYSNAFIYTSDERLKNKGPKLDGLRIIGALNGYHFKWKADGRADIGVMAQDVEKVLPEAVHEVPGAEQLPGGTKSVDYARLVAPLIEAVKAQQQEIEELRLQLRHVQERGEEK